MALEHVQPRGNRRVYRRKVPKALQGILGKTEMVLRLGKTDAEVRKQYDATHAEAEQIFAKAWDELHGVKAPAAKLTARELFDQATKRLRDLGFNPFRANGSGDPDDADELDEWITRDVVAEGIVKGYPRDKDTDHPVGVSSEDRALLKILTSPSTPKGPSPTLEDAKRLYLKDRFTKTNPSEKSKKRDEQQADRVVGHVKSALGYDPVLADMKRSDARTVADAMLKEIPTAATVDRYLNVVRAIIAHGIREFDLTGTKNQFEKLDVADSAREPDKRKRLPFTPEQLAATRERVLDRAAADLQQIWRLLEGTGCRLSEITGLRVSDVMLEAQYPHIDVEWHDERRVKTEVSRRKVPLIGDALQAAREAVKAAGNSKMLFARYGHEGGGDKASAALGKHVRAAVTDRKVTTHSLRHRMEDLLVIAWVPEKLKRSIMGHSGGGAGDNYGGEEARLKVATEAMVKALGPSPATSQHNQN
ncbi:tyrosine-type recombinase/integrase [Mesorhizobium sp. AR10]|uniref:tyrosine-type recombinase/integrase n=1 Tax=Mesorhizobium sp. AR10 TaxID=2865839 RepID=UPI00215F8BBE|nr:tyrosine-type recombinase/integrase [Mesorhizobium sp. AR10]UVK36840.1 tyrosine-type recombinase/integrase [Mesorhizobium sp. AR10]